MFPLLPIWRFCISNTQFAQDLKTLLPTTNLLMSRIEIKLQCIQFKQVKYCLIKNVSINQVNMLKNGHHCWVEDQTFLSPSILFTLHIFEPNAILVIPSKNSLNSSASRSEEWEQSTMDAYGQPLALPRGPFPKYLVLLHPYFGHLAPLCSGSCLTLPA